MGIRDRFRDQGTGFGLGESGFELDTTLRPMTTTVIIAGAGASRRFHESDDPFADDRKQPSKIEVDLNGKPAHTTAC